jgi:mercuric ion binding protein
MKIPVFFFLSMALAIVGNPLMAQGKRAVTTTFWVGGVCEMCKERIERAVDVPGVKSANYELSTHQLTVTFNPRKIAEEKLHELINKAGHDTAKSRATDESYKKIHSCCKYRDHNHND